MKRYLTSQGLQTLWNQIKALFATKSELNQKASKTELNTLSESVSASLSEIEQTDIRQDASISSLSENKADKTALSKLSTDTTTALDKKVDKVSGMGLSHNDYTTAEKNKLSGIASGAEVNTIVAVQRNGTAITPKDRVVNILVPVKTSELNNDSTYQTAADVAETIVGVKLDLASGIITLTRKNGTTFTLDLPTEKIIKSGYYDSKTKEIVLVLEDESEIRFSASELIDEYYADESTLELYTDTADGNKKKFRIKTAYKNKIDGSEQTTNKTASVSSSSTETQYPTAKAVYNAVKDLATKVQTFTTASTRANIESGETISTIFGKIRKWLADLKAVAFSGSYNDLSNTPELPTIATTTKAGLIKSGGDVTVDASGNVSVNDDSHNHSAANITSGTLSIERGGTGGTTRRVAEFNLLGSDDSIIDGSIIDDNRRFALLNLDVSPENGAFRWMTFSGVWTYIQTKIKDVLGLTASTYNGTATKATADGNGNNISETYLKRSGGLVTGSIEVRKGSYCVGLLNGMQDGVSGYVHFFSVKITQSYMSEPFWIDVSSRDRIGRIHIYIQSGVGTTINLASIAWESDHYHTLSTYCINPVWYKVTGDTLDLYWQKSQNYDYVTINNINMGLYARQHTEFTHKNELVTTTTGLTQVTERGTARQTLELTDSNLATYFSNGTLTIPNGTTTVIFNTSSVKTVYLVKGTVQTNGYRLTIGGTWHPDTNSDYQGLEGCFPYYVDYHYFGHTGTSLPNFDAYSHFADYIYFNGMWFSKMY